MDRIMVEDSGELNLRSDHNLIWCEVRTYRLEEGTSDPHLKWMIDGKIEWEKYQQLVIEDFRGWEEHMEVLWMGTNRESVQQIWKLWRHIVLLAVVIGIGKKKLMDRSRGWWSPGIEAAIQAQKYPIGNIGKLGVAM